MASVEIETATPLKRNREETQVPELEENKKLKSYNHILSILDDEEEEPTQDISTLFTTLQQELSSSDSESASFDLLASLPTHPGANPSAVPSILEDSSYSSSASSVCNEEDDKGRVMRHLLEASDDELGIPNADVVIFDDGEEAVGDLGGGEGFLLGDGLWEFEDEAANYYTLLQSELFM